MIQGSDLYGIKHYLYGEAYYGSDGSMRFRLARDPLKNVIYASEEERMSDSPVLKASVWKGPMSYDNTPEEEITSKEFEFSQDGYTAAVAWLNEINSD